MKPFTKFGNWIFHYRNGLFPLFYAALFIPSRNLFPDPGWALISGGVIIGIGILIRSTTIGLVYIIRGGANRKIHAKNLVTEGIYSVCRNPMYLGNILIILGFGLLSNSICYLSIFFPLFLLFYAAIIHAEEDFLRNKFGQEYSDYVATSNALLPRLNKLKGAFKGHSFQWKRVISKEQNSLILYFTGICLILLLDRHIGLLPFIIAQSALLLLYAVLKYMKRKKLLT
jgi:protein-S-isoprenylcysteine O-methyltransferase Ste14